MGNKTSDINVGSIEEDVDELKSIMNLRTVSGFAYSQKNTLSLQKAIKNVLADYTRQKEMNEEHQKINGELREKVQELEKNSNCDSVYATSDKNVANIEGIMSQEAFNELIDNLEVVATLTMYGRKSIKHYVKEMQAELERKDKRIQELEKERDHWHGCFIVAMENGIAKEKVKNVLKNNRNEIFSATYLSREQFRPYEMQIERINKIEQELIGEDK